ncbi:potassium channel family protein [Hansschlegelia beijingensis]|uniref:Voltage-gated potassium channel n=1 Tax=Hansschlegelia beijingensis TaxID=1133344 RepID=A0A7W6D1D3_9HYPH|nr:potassium channel family protein [Hansschlegelia beijingensis]MBB3972866.1 voltage-gated potassium channel [Hansschlegelia beijingensis]
MASHLESVPALPAPRSPLRRRLNRLYHGETPAALRFQCAVVAVDLAIIGFFLATPLLGDGPVFLWLDYSIALLVGLDLAARALAADDLRRWLKRPDVWVDGFIFVTLLAPLWIVNLGFLRVLRLWTLSRSPVVWRPMRRAGYAHWEDATRAVVNLTTFLFVTTGFVYTFFANRADGIEGYVDALYFTVATVTTTGFGDVTLPGPWGRLTSVVAMIVGISLFVRLAQAIFRPRKVTFSCPQCALMRHEPDAVHCKACGHQLKIPDGDD